MFAAGGGRPFLRRWSKDEGGGQRDTSPPPRRLARTSSLLVRRALLINRPRSRRNLRTPDPPGHMPAQPEPCPAMHDSVAEGLKQRKHKRGLSRRSRSRAPKACRFNGTLEACAEWRHSSAITDWPTQGSNAIVPPSSPLLRPKANPSVPQWQVDSAAMKRKARLSALQTATRQTSAIVRAL